MYLAKSGRPGPCWLDIPLNVQGLLWKRRIWRALIRRIMKWRNRLGTMGNIHAIPEDEAGKGEKRQLLPGEGEQGNALI